MICPLMTDSVEKGLAPIGLIGSIGVEQTAAQCGTIRPKHIADTSTGLCVVDHANRPGRGLLSRAGQKLSATVATVGLRIAARCRRAGAQKLTGHAGFCRLVTAAAVDNCATFVLKFVTFAWGQFLTTPTSFFA
jgi:hypothetical protein